MFLRPHHRDKDGKRHTYWSLVETIRTADGPRQRTLCTQLVPIPGGTMQSADIVLPTTDGREIRLRRVTEPTLEQQRLLDQLDIPIPTHLEWNAECSADFVTS